LLVGTLLAGVALSSVRHHLHTPMNPLFVDIYNETEEIIPSVVIEHGNINTQEKIQAIRIEPGEHRIIALNHQPELGFNIKANYANGKESEICAGKWSKERYLRASVWSYGIYITEIR
ncbi:MAG: hypothetical protein V3U78_07990, partial [Thiotrichaceae bacterium]